MTFPHRNTSQAVSSGLVGFIWNRILLCVLSTLLCLPYFAGCTGDGGGPKARQTLLIVIDTLRFDRLGAYGQIRETRPVIDQLAKDGRLFKYAYAPSPWTVPSTASIMTSLLPRQHGAGMPGVLKECARRGLLSQEIEGVLRRPWAN